MHLLPAWVALALHENQLVQKVYEAAGGCVRRAGSGRGLVCDVARGALQKASGSSRAPAAKAPGLGSPTMRGGVLVSILRPLCESPRLAAIAETAPCESLRFSVFPSRFSRGICSG